MSLSSTAAANNSLLLATHLKSAGQATVVFLALYSVIPHIGLVRKRGLLAAARASGKQFDRYTSPEMFTLDRLHGNFLEWSPVYLGLLWTLATAQVLEGATLAVAWTYVGLRALYMGLVLQYGVNREGMNKALWPSTFPAYGCLLYMMTKAVGALFIFETF